MKKAKWILLGVGAAVLIAALVLCLSFCGKPGDANDPDAAAPTAGESTEYTVLVTAEEGTPLEGVGIYIYQDETKSELVWFDKTNKDGKITFTDLARETYVAVLSNLPTGYVADEMYPLTGTTTEIVLRVGVMTEEDMANIKYMLGDKILDFSVTDVDGVTYSLYDLLQTKKAVMLNFWYINCEPCGLEFPYMAEAYADNKDDIEILAMNPVDTDAVAIAQYKKDNGLPFPVVAADPLWANMMQITGYPTTVIIDRYGNISLIHKGGIESANTFDQIFKYFTADEYVARPIKSIDEIVTELPVGTKENPFETGSFDKFDITVKAGETYYIRLYKQVEKYYLSIEGKDCDGDFTLLYKEDKYEDDDGELTVYIKPEGAFIPVELQVTNNSEEEQTYTLKRSSPKGSYGNPYKLKLEEFEAKVSAGNDQGTYFTYTAEEDGELRITVLESSVGNNFGLTLYNLNSYAMRNWDSDMNQRDEEGRPYLAVAAKKGQKIQFILNTEPNDSNKYPAGTFKLLATFGEGDGKDITINDLPKTTYKVTVTDQFGEAMENVQVDINGDFTYVYVFETEEAPGEGEESTQAIAEGETPVAPDSGETTEPENPGSGETTEPENPDSGETTEPENPDSGETTDPENPGEGETEPETKEFHIQVKASYKTDTDGVVTTEQITGPYTATVHAPEGYRLETVRYDLTAEAPEVAVQMHKIIYKDYAVKLQYADGTPAAGVAVMLGTDFVNTDANGMASFLHKEESQYTVSLASLPAGYTLAGNLTAAIFPAGETSMTLTLLEMGSAENPVEVTEYPFEAPALAAGEKLYVNFHYSSAPVLVVQDKDAVVGYNGAEYTADAETGILELALPQSEEMTVAQVVFSHTAAEEKTLDIQMNFPVGSRWNPQAIEDLEDIQLVLAEGNADGWYYSYTKAFAGTLALHLNSVTPEGILYQATITSETTGELPLATDTQVYTKANEPAVIYVRALPVTLEDGTIVNPALTLALTGEFAIDWDAVEEGTAVYTVTVKDYNDTVLPGVMVQILKSGTPVFTDFTNEEGVVEALLASGEYTVTLAVTGETKYYYEQWDAVFPAGVTALEIKMTSNVPGAPVTDKDAYIVGEASLIEVGTTYITMPEGLHKYFLFRATEPGTYRVTTSNPNAVPSYWGMVDFPFEIASAYNAEGNYVDISVGPDQLNITNVIGFIGTTEAIVTIERVGSHAWSIEEEPYSTDWQSDYVPVKVKFQGNVNKLTYVDMMDASKHYNLVFNENDQYYHLGSVDGPVLYMNFGKNAPITSVQVMMHGEGAYGGRGLSRIFLTEGATKVTEETFVKKEAYTECMDAHIAQAYVTGDYILYPVTKDIMYAISNGCHEMWDDPNNMLYTNFEGAVEGRQWMFAVCYIDDGSVDLSAPAPAAEEMIPEQEEALLPKEEELLPPVTEEPVPEIPAEPEEPETAETNP